MAYQFSVIADGTSRTNGYVDFNITPAVSSHTNKGEVKNLISPGTQISISGKAYAKNIAVKSIRITVMYEYYHSAGGFWAGSDTGCVAYINKNIAKNTAATFSMTFRITKELWQYIYDGAARNLGDTYTHCVISQIYFDLCPAAAVAGSPGESLDSSTYQNNLPANTVQLWGNDGSADFRKYAYSMYLTTHVPSAITASDFTDRAATSALTVFGAFATGNSLPRLAASWSIDANYPAQLHTHSLALTGAMSATYEASTGSGVSSVTFDLPTPTAAGTVNWTYTVTDMFGNTDTETGSFTVYAYSPPAITNLLLERYAVVPDAGGEAHEASDDGTHLWLTLAAGIAAVNSRNAWTAVMTYWDAALGESSAVTVTSQDGWTLGGTDGTAISLARDEAQLAGITADDTKDWRFRLTITDALNNSATLVFDGIVKAGAVLDVSPGGVGVGMRCTGTEGGGELFQCAYPARFASEVIGSDYTFTKTSGNANVNRILAQRSGSVVNIELRVALTAATSAGSNVIVGTLSGGPLPSIGISTAAGFTSSSTAVLSITPSGEITVRAIAASYGSNGATVYWRFMFLTND